MRRFVTALAAATLTVVAPPAVAQAATPPPSCSQNANDQQYYWEKPGAWGTTQVSRSANGVIVAVKSGRVTVAGGGGATVPVGWALLTGGTRSVGVYEKVKMQISTDGGRTVARDCGWYDSYYSYEAGGRIATSTFWRTRSDSSYRFRACGRVKAQYDYATVCTSWW